MKGLLPQSARQLFLATVTLVIDYASPLWYPGRHKRTIKLLERAQRLGCQSIVRAFRTTAYAILETEAVVDPISDRPHKHLESFWVRRCTLSKAHPVRKLATKPCRRYKSPLQRILELLEKLVTRNVEEIHRFCVSPASVRARTVIEERGAAGATAIENNTDWFMVFTDGSMRKGRSGGGLCFPQTGYRAFATLGAEGKNMVRSTELSTIRWALNQVQPQQGLSVHVFTDCLSAVRSIRRPREQSAQSVIRDIHREAERLLSLAIHWVPKDAAVECHKVAHD